MRVAIFGSTNGTDLNYISFARNNGKLDDIDFVFILSNKEKAGILKKAESLDAKPIYLSGKGKTREQYDEEVSMLLDDHDIDLVLLIGYMRLMTPDFVKRWYGRVMNIHPSLLPAYAGGMDLNVHEAVLKRGCKYTGATLIFIDEGADTGPIISQQIVSVSDFDTPETLKEKVQEAEGDLLVEALQAWREGVINLKDGKVTIR